MLLRLVMLIAVSVFLNACSLRGSERFLESNTDEILRSKSAVQHPDRAIVFFFRNNSLGTANPGLIPPFYFAVDEHLVSTMPLGTYIRLSLPPGKHKFTRLYELNGWRGIGFDRVDLDVQLQAGQTYYISATNGIGLLMASLKEVDAENGQSFLSTAVLAKQYHMPIALDSFMSRSIAARTEAVTKPKPDASSPVPSATVPAQAATPSALPSAQQVTRVLEVLAVVAFVALLVVGAAAMSQGGDAGMASLPPPMPASNSRVEVVKPIEVAKPLVASQWQTSSGVVGVSTVNQNQTIFNTSTGVIYRTHGNQMSGSDGSYYQRVGNTWFSNTGQTYQISGNSLLTSDGRRCTKTGVLVSCH